MTREFDGSERSEDRLPPIDVRMLVEPAADCVCPPREEDATVKQSFHMDNGGKQPCKVVLEGENGVEYQHLDACEACPCFVMETHDCISELREIRDGRLLYSVVLSDRSNLAPLVESLRASGATVSVTRILTAGEGEESRPPLTEKQRETLLMAIENGYYDRPRRTTLGDLAAELGVTNSAASQRLNSAKRRLVEAYAKKFEA